MPAFSKKDKQACLACCNWPARFSSFRNSFIFSIKQLVTKMNQSKPKDMRDLIDRVLPERRLGATLVRVNQQLERYFVNKGERWRIAWGYVSQVLLILSNPDHYLNSQQGRRELMEGHNYIGKMISQPDS